MEHQISVEENRQFSVEGFLFRRILCRVILAIRYINFYSRVVKKRNQYIYFQILKLPKHNVVKAVVKIIIIIKFGETL